jgi:ribose 1,5-bisphosphate isomerase
LNEIILDAAKRIKNLDVQGARNVAIVAIKSIKESAKKSKAKSKKSFLQELTEAKLVLFNSRSTEPLMRNAIRYIIKSVESSNKTHVQDLVTVISQDTNDFLEQLEISKEKIAKIGSKRISNNSIVLTHCHSSTVTNMLRKAKLDGRDFRIICTESRPVFQGRITAKEMLNSDIDTTLIVDSAVRLFMNKVDLVVVGADAITSEGNVINKIGTSMIALAAKEARTPFYVVSDLLKFDPATVLGDYESIEQRNTEEVWENPPDGLVIKNPAFDITRREFIHGIICEEGVVSPDSVNEVLNRKYPWIFKAM